MLGSRENVMTTDPKTAGPPPRRRASNNNRLGQQQLCNRRLTMASVHIAFPTNLSAAPL
jgi:hypothetical protein